MTSEMQRLGVELENIDTDMFNPNEAQDGASASFLGEGVMTPPPVASPVNAAPRGGQCDVEDEYNVDAGELPANFTDTLLLSSVPGAEGSSADLRVVPASSAKAETAAALGQQDDILVEEEYDLSAGSALDMLHSFSAFLASTSSDAVVEQEVLGFGSDFDDDSDLEDGAGDNSEAAPGAEVFQVAGFGERFPTGACACAHLTSLAPVLPFQPN
jgi:hypothetical protein